MRSGLQFLCLSFSVTRRTGSQGKQMHAPKPLPEPGTREAVSTSRLITTASENEAVEGTRVGAVQICSPCKGPGWFTTHYPSWEVTSFSMAQVLHREDVHHISGPLHSTYLFVGRCSSVCMRCIYVHMCCVCDLSMCTCVMYVMCPCTRVCRYCIYVHMCLV